METSLGINDMQLLLHNLMSADNTVRIQSELNFKHFMEFDPNSFSSLLIQIALNNSNQLNIRQSSLLHLKMIVPFYWSPAFDKFIGPNTINQDVKSLLRDSLLTLVADSDSKIRSSAAYAIVQIAAVDYPDEWPSLLNHLYNTTIDINSSMFAVVGSLLVLQEIFDDVVTDEQLFEGGIAIQVLNTCETLLVNDNYTIDVKVETLRLLKILCQSFDNVDFEIANRGAFCDTVIPQVYELLLKNCTSLSQQNSINNQLVVWDFKHEIYSILNTLINSFANILGNYIQDSFNVVLQDIKNQESIVVGVKSKDYNDINFLKSIFIDVDHFLSTQREGRDLSQFLSFTILKEFSFLQTLIELENVNDVNKISQILDPILNISTLSMNKVEAYNDDFNEFVTDESGLNVEIMFRDGPRDLLSEMNAKDNLIFINLLIEKFYNCKDSSNGTYLQLEAITFLLGCCFDNDDSIVGEPTFDLEKFLKSSFMIIQDVLRDDNVFYLLVSRLILMVPKFLFKYSSAYDNNFSVECFNQICSSIQKLGDHESLQYVKASVLMSLQYFNYFIRAKEFNKDIQIQLIEIVYKLSENSDADTNLMLLEVLTIVISMDNQNLVNDSNTLKLILTIGFNGESNFALNNSMFECIDDLLKNIEQSKYNKLMHFVLPYLLEKVSNHSETYSSSTDLSLQVLATFLKNKGEDLSLSKELFDSSFSIISNFINTTIDDELIQSSSETLVELIKTSTDLCGQYIDTKSGENGIQILLKTVSNLLSPNMSDRAIVKLGDLISLLLNNFHQHIDQYLNDILKSLTIRLVHAKEVPTIENMVLIFNNLAISQPQATLSFLKSFQIDEQPAIVKILPIWFQAYEVMRGYNSIFSNVRAFIEIFSTNDEFLSQLMVDGNPLPHQVAEGVIITRSMAKKMPIQFEKIPANAKIIRLLLDELKNEMTSSEQIPGLQNHSDQHHENHDHNHHNEEEDDDGEGWEDLDDIDEGNFEQLKSYVDEGGEEKRGSDRSTDDMKTLLIEFFKQCTTKNISNFQEIYQLYLSDVQKRLLSEYLVFTN
ncbi:Kap114 protein [Pichia kluyveri]|uniref:Kap114 protein n=1 Tax=Pichia kluyveri TaxID=36015 RepID=A0AAV5R4J6_PICKL|nr:Kap114 protein [Pichia kluyveri]